MHAVCVVVAGNAYTNAAYVNVLRPIKALEELAMNYDQKSQEVESKNKENESLSEQLSEKLNSLNNIEVSLYIRVR